MPERIVSNLSALSKWKDEIELAVVFWIIGATIGVGQHLLSPDPLSWRLAIGRALSVGGLATVAGTALVMHPTMSPLSQIGIAAGIGTLGAAAHEMELQRRIIGRKP